MYTYLQTQKLFKHIKTHVYIFTDTKVIKNVKFPKAWAQLKTVHSSGPNEIM